MLTLLCQVLAPTGTGFPLSPSISPDPPPCCRPVELVYDPPTPSDDPPAPPPPPAPEAVDPTCANCEL